MVVKVDWINPIEHTTVYDLLKKEKTMKIRMLIDQKGSPDGIQVNEYEAGKKYDLPANLAQVFLDNNWAEEDKAFDSAPEKKARARRKARKK